jgi:hypothetical protein
VAFLVIAALGLAWLPGGRAIWIVFLVFGAATVPQVTIWWVGDLKRRR